MERDFLLFFLYELLENNRDLKVAILEQGFRANKRVCPLINVKINTDKIIHFIYPFYIIEDYWIGVTKNMQEILLN